MLSCGEVSGTADVDSVGWLSWDEGSVNTGVPCWGSGAGWLSRDEALGTTR